MIKLGVPSKGRLMEKTFDWFGQRGVTLSRSGAEREYAGQVEGVEGLELVLLSRAKSPVNWPLAASTLGLRAVIWCVKSWRIGTPTSAS
jgi:ATP phosphoribosyltransferase